VNRKKIIVLVASVALLLALVLTGCPPKATPTPSATATPTPSATVTPTPSATVAPTPSGTATPTPLAELSYNVLSPRGIALPVKFQGLSPRLKLPLDGKTIFIIQGEADPVIMPALALYAPEKLPNVTWNYYNPSSSFGGTTVDATTKAAANGLIRGIGW